MRVRDVGVVRASPPSLVPLDRDRVERGGAVSGGQAPEVARRTENRNIAKLQNVRSEPEPRPASREASTKGPASRQSPESRSRETEKVSYPMRGSKMTLNKRV